MITFYKADETDFDNNGLGVLDHDIQNPDIEEKLNDIFTFSFNYPIFGVNGSRLAARMIVKADDPENEGQLFRIMKLSKSNGMLTAFCYHIFYDLNGNEIPDTNIVGQNGQTAITQMLSKTAVAHKFQGYSDISDIANIRVVRMSPVKFLIDPQTDNNFINRLGGEIRRVNYRIWMNKVRGSDNGATIRWKKSLDSYNATWDYTTIATRIRPVGYNGIMLPESYVDSPLIDKYETIVIKEIQYSDIKAIDPNATSNDETAVPLEQAYELLRQAAAKDFSGNNLDKPTVALSVNMVALRNMDEYKDVKSLEAINPWDTVTVINERDGLSVKVRLNHYHWNPVTHKFISMELGNAKSTFTDIGSKVDHATNLANQANDTANTATESANGKNSNYHGPNEPYKPVDGDLWYKKNGDKTELWQYDGKSVPPGWKLVVDDATGEEVRQNVDAAQKEAEEAKNQANKAVDGANDAVAKAGFANDTATQAKSDAAAATQNATTALTNAGTALTNAKNALTNSNSAQADSAQARKDSATAKIQAANAATQANQAVTDASTAKADANTAKANATQAINDAATAKGQAANALGQANTAINNAADALDKFNNMQVGGRNLYLNSKAIDDSYAKNRISTKITVEPFDSTTNMWHIVAEQGTGSPNGIYLLGYANNKLPDTTDWSYSIDIKGTGKVRTFGIENGSMNPIVGAVGTEWSRISQTGHVDNERKTLVMYFDCNSSPLDVYIKLPKLEIGNTPTDWSLAPEDVQQQFTDINGELANKVSQTTYNALAGTVDTVNTLAKQNQSTISTLATKTSVDTVNHTATTAQTLAQQNANELLNKANSTTVNTLTQRVTTAESTLKQTATTAQLAMTQKDVDGLSDTVTIQGLDITAMADGLKLKADITTVDTLTQTVNKQGSQLALTATKAELGLTQTNVDSLKKTVTSNTAGMTANANALKLKADSSTVSSLDGRVTKLSGQLDVQANLISAKVTANDVTGMLGNYATQSWSEGKISAAKNEISASVKTVKQTVDDIQVGGTNLLTGTAKCEFHLNNIGGTRTIQKYDDETNYIQYTSNTPINIMGFYWSLTPDVGQVYTLSADVCGNGNIPARYFRYEGGGYGSLGQVNLTNDWQRISNTFRVNATSGAWVIYASNSTLLKIKHIKIEKGNQATDWSPAPEDQATIDWTKSQLDITDKKITAVITTVTNTLNNNIASATANMATTTWTNTQIDAAKTAINLSVEQSITTSENTLNNNIANATKDMATQTWTQGQINTTADNINLSVSKVQTDLSGTKTQFAELAVKVDGIQTTVSGKADQSQVTQLADQITSVVGDVSANSSQITQMKADINLRVKAGDVVNQINISPEGILIDGKKVHITGLTRIDNAVIKDAMIADIKADKITAGTLNAANVDVINLNANSITTGTLKGTNLSMNLNTGEVLFQKGSIKSANGNLNLDISKGTMAVINEYKSGFYFEDGKLVLNDGWLEGTSSQPKYGSLEYNANYFTVNGLAVKGTEGVTIGTPGYNPLAMFTPVKESGIAIDKKHIEIGSVGPTIISSGNEFFMNLWTQSPFIAVGTTVDGNHMTTSDPGSRISLYAEYVHIKSAYSKTASGSANVIVAADGALVRSTSASKYKTDIIRTNATDYGEKLLNLPTATWTDIAETKRYRDDSVNQIKPTRNFGMIAEDLAEAGLEMLVVRGTDGELEGINYDRIGPALIPVIAKLKNKIEKLEQKLEEPA